MKKLWKVIFVCGLFLSGPVFSMNKRSSWLLKNIRKAARRWSPKNDKVSPDKIFRFFKRKKGCLKGLVLENNANEVLLSILQYFGQPEWGMFVIAFRYRLFDLFSQKALWKANPNLRYPAWLVLAGCLYDKDKPQAQQYIKQHGIDRVVITIFYFSQNAGIKKLKKNLSYFEPYVVRPNVKQRQKLEDSISWMIESADFVGEKAFECIKKTLKCLLSIEWQGGQKINNYFFKGILDRGVKIGCVELVDIILEACMEHGSLQEGDDDRALYKNRKSVTNALLDDELFLTDLLKTAFLLPDKKKLIVSNIDRKLLCHYAVVQVNVFTSAMKEIMLQEDKPRPVDVYDWMLQNVDFKQTTLNIMLLRSAQEGWREVVELLLKKAFFNVIIIKETLGKSSDREIKKMLKRTMKI